GKPIPGLLAAGELTGVAGINGRYGGSGTFLAPSVLMGRIAGRKAAEHASRDATDFVDYVDADIGSTADAARVDADATTWQQTRAGYRHFEDSHRVVSARDYACGYCHTADWPASALVTRQARIARLESCKNCH
ncbi:MAG: hypothetical protein KJO13_12105, partial [Gammaproteobacteria bacterium]|nr:hypothetical protein [Gammaproteobacteria bacterium]